MLEENKEIVRRFVDEYQTGRDEGVADELVASDFVHHYGRGWTEASTEGREGVKLSFGKEVAIDAIDIVRIANGQIVDHWAVTDVMGFMQQVGAVPLPPSAAAG